MSSNSGNDKFSIEDILSDIAKMKDERGESENETNYGIADIFEEDITSLDGFSDYSEEIPQKPKAPQNLADIETDKNGQDMFGAVTNPRSNDFDFEDIFSDSHVSSHTAEWTKIVDMVKNPVASSETESDIEKTKIVENVSPSEPVSVPRTETNEMVDGQMILQGFIDDEILSTLDEDQVEKDLKERSRKNLEKFKLYRVADEYVPDIPAENKLFDDEEKPGEDGYDDDAEHNSLKEYRHIDQKKNFIKMLLEDRRSAFLSFCGLLVCEIALIILSVLSNSAEGTAKTVYYGICLLLLSVSAALSVSDIISGFGALFKLKPTCKSAAALLVVTTIIHTIISFIFLDSPGLGKIYCAAAGFSLLISKLTELFKSVGILENFKFCAFEHPSELFSVKSVESKPESNEIGKPLMLGEPNLKYSQKTKFPSKFFENSDFTTAADRLCKYMLPSAAGLGLIAALSAWIKTKVVLGALTAFTASLCISLPACAAVAIIIPSVVAMLYLNKKGGMISSPDCASETANANAVLLDSFELYDLTKCGLDGFADKKTVRIDDVLMYAAALIIGTKGPLSEAFEEVVGNSAILPPVKNLIYEEKLGISGFIHGQSVLLGNRNLLINHSIEAPAKSDEMKHLQLGKRVLYIAIGNKIAAMLVLNYIENENLTKPLQAIEKSGISILVNSVDCNITEEFINEGFSLKPGIVKLMSPASGKIFRKRRYRETNSSPAKVLHTGSTESFLRCIATSAVIGNIQRFAALLQIGFCAIGWLILLILLLSGGLSEIGWEFVTVFTAVWTALSTAFGFWQTYKLK